MTEKFIAVLRRAVVVSLMLAGVSLATSGCKKKQPAVETPVARQPDAATNPQAVSAPAPVRTSSVLTQPDGQVDMPELQRSVIRWVLANRRRPVNFEDFAATAGVQIPPPPAGKKYILNKEMHVLLVNR
jgi:hypothetical protein